MWIGHIQWARRNGYEPPRDPVLRPLDTIRCRDAVLDGEGRAAEWPEADGIIGNPPFLGDKAMTGTLGEGYTRRLRAAYAGRVPGGADLVCYWFEKAREAIEAGRTKRAGLVAANSIRGGANRRVLDRICETGAIFDAWPDEAWALDGAAVRVSLICFGKPSSVPPRFKGQAAGPGAAGSVLERTAGPGRRGTFSDRMAGPEAARAFSDERPVRGAAAGVFGQRSIRG